MRIAPLDNETLLLRQLAHGEATAFKTIMQAYADPIYSVALLYLKQPQLAEDIVQSVFMKLWETRADAPHKKEFVSWLYITARNLMVSELRKRSVQEKYVDFLRSRMELSGESPEYELLRKEQQALVREAVNHLSPQQKTAFLLHREEGLSYEGIAERMGIGVQTVRSHLYKALDHVRSHVLAHASKELVILLSLLAGGHK